MARHSSGVPRNSEISGDTASHNLVRSPYLNSNLKINVNNNILSVRLVNRNPIWIMWPGMYIFQLSIFAVPSRRVRIRDLEFFGTCHLVRVGT